MSLSTEQILTYLQLPKLGRITAFAMANYAENTNTDLHSFNEMFDYIKLCKEKKIARSFADYTLTEINQASVKAKDILMKSEDEQIGTISYYDSDFPKQLKGIQRNCRDASPLILFYKGSLHNLLDVNGVAIVGTRKPTNDGVLAGEYFGKVFAENRFNIISGLAVGCDSSAHRGALLGHGITTAFLAHGLDTIYPKENINLAQKIVDGGGLLISEYAIGTPPMANYFVERDRLQSGLSDATIVIQTGIRGGTMHAVHSTIENNKPLFAVQYKDPILCKQEKVLGNVKLLNEKTAQPITAKNIDCIIDIIKKSKMQKEHSHDNLF